jgi:transposase-like protein
MPPSIGRGRGGARRVACLAGVARPADDFHPQLHRQNVQHFGNEIWNNTKLRSSIYLNNIIEPDHRGQDRPMLGFKRFRRAKVTIVGIELFHRILKNHFDLSKLTNS